jgi:hypothetical protein
MQSLSPASIADALGEPTLPRQVRSGFMKVVGRLLKKYKQGTNTWLETNLEHALILLT